MKVLVTGCAGLLGANYARHLVDQGHTVIGLDNLFSGYRAFLPKSDRFTFRKVNLENRKIVSKVVEEHTPDVVFHFAAYAAEGLSPFIRNFNYRNNIVCSANIINECITHNCKLVFTSSMAVYGDQDPPFHEEMTPQPADPYGIAKHAVESDIKLASSDALFGLRYNIIRPHNVLGQYQNIWDRYRNVIGIFIRQTLGDEPMLVYGDGEQTRAFSDIRYYMDPFDKLLTGFDNETFNIGADKYYTIRETAETVQRVAASHGYDAEIRHTPPRHEVKHAYCDHSKAQRLLGFEDRTELEPLIESVFTWAMKQPKRMVKDMDYEVTKDLYDFWK